MGLEKKLSNVIMKFLVFVSLCVAFTSAEAEADAFYAPYGSQLRYPAYQYASRYQAPLLSSFIPSVRRVIAAPVVQRVLPAQAVPAVKAVPAVQSIMAKAVPAVPAVVSKAATPAVPSLVSTQYHAQDEDKNFSFGYSNINSARHEAGNAYPGVTGSYTDGRNTVNYVADAYGFRRI